LGRLEKRFGAYRELPGNDYEGVSGTSKISEPKPLDKSNDNAGWRAYIAGRNEFYRDNKRAKDQQSMTQRQERQDLKIRQSEERHALFVDCKARHSTRAYVNQQRAIISTQHAYETAVLKALQKKQRDGQKRISAKYLSFERWLLEHGSSSQADEYRHRKDKRYIRFECPAEANANMTNIESPGILGFTMTHTKQGTKFSREGTLNQAAFVDTGRLIRVYDTEENSLLAALQLAQAKWGSVKIDGTDEYKRRCAELAAQHGIRVHNPELQDLVKESQRKNRPPMSPEMARNTVEHEALLLRNRHNKVWSSYTEHKKTLSGLLAAEPQKPKLFGHKKWKLEHGKWTKERDNLAAQIVADIEALGVKSSAYQAEKEAEAHHKRYDELAFEEALRLNPEAAAIIREDNARLEREERAKREAEEACAREEKEENKRFRTAIMELAAKFGKEAFIITNAQEGKTYGGLILGAVEKNGYHYAAQIMYDGHVILHNVEKSDLPEIASIAGKDVEIRNVYGRIGTIVEKHGERERNRGWSR
jgi:hypothetical protein